jgi:hypothetical protein
LKHHSRHELLLLLLLPRHHLLHCFHNLHHLMAMDHKVTPQGVGLRKGQNRKGSVGRNPCCTPDQAGLSPAAVAANAAAGCVCCCSFV